MLMAVPFREKFVNLLAGAAYWDIVREHPKTGAPRRIPFASMRARALRLVAKELTARLATGSKDFRGLHGDSIIPRDPAYRLLQDLGEQNVGTGGGITAVRWLLTRSPRDSALYTSGVTVPQTPAASLTYTVKLTEINQEYASLLSDLGDAEDASQAVDETLWAATVTAYSDGRDAILADLNARFPDMGFT